MNDAVVALLAYLTQSFGGSLGWAIITLSMGIRVALLPLTIRLARRAQRTQEMMRALQPEIEQLRKRFEEKPERFFEEMHMLYKRHDCSPFDIRILSGSLVQLPIFGILYASIRSSLSANSAFLWIRNLALPDFYLALLILALTGVSAYLMPSASEQTRSTLIAIQLIFTFFIVWKLAAGLSLYWLSSGAVTVFQTVWLCYRSDTGPRVA
jgi:YidC/Oxa1 family membrane protein insertase